MNETADDWRVGRDVYRLLLGVADVLLDAYPSLGDDALVSDDVALQRIYDLFQEADVDWLRAARARRERRARQRRRRKS